MVVEIDNEFEYVIDSPDDITPSVMGDLLGRYYSDNDDNDDSISSNDNDVVTPISSVTCHPLGRGVLSNVQIITVNYDHDDCPTSWPTKFIAKFQKPEIPLANLFVIEGNFYKWIGGNHHHHSNNAFPFQLANCVAASSSFLLLEHVDNANHRNVEEGCPPSKFVQLMDDLAKLHGRYWIDSSSSSSSAVTTTAGCPGTLSDTPGAGHELPINVRHDQFVSSWPDVRRRLIPFMGSELQRLDALVDWIVFCGSAGDCDGGGGGEDVPIVRRIEHCALLVSQWKCTLIHGDYHVGNMLFPRREAEASSSSPSPPQQQQQQQPRPYLVDWSMAGIGNPLVDFVFFLVVGAPIIPIHDVDNRPHVHADSDAQIPLEDVTSDILHQILQRYHSILCKEVRLRQNQHTDEPNCDKSSLLHYDNFLQTFRTTVLNQFVLLVCYDSMCRNVIENKQHTGAEEEGMLWKEKFHNHFDQVNVRCVRILLSKYGWREDMFE